MSGQFRTIAMFWYVNTKLEEISVNSNLWNSGKTQGHKNTEVQKTHKHKNTQNLGVFLMRQDRVWQD